MPRTTVRFIMCLRSSARYHARMSPQTRSACYALCVQNRHALLSALLVVSACEAGNSPIASRQHAPQATTPKPPTAAAEVPTPAPNRPAPQPAHGNGVEWRGAIEWHEWSEAIGIATRTSKPIMVVVYADWCPHCRALGPVFSD